MEAEIRRLTYVPSFAGSKTGSGTPPVGSFIGQLPPPLAKEELLKQGAKMPDVRLQARVIELERERTESDRHHRESLVPHIRRLPKNLPMHCRGKKKDWSRSMRVASKRPSPYFRSRSSGISLMPKSQLFDWHSVSPGGYYIGKHKWIRYCYEAP